MKKVYFAVVMLVIGVSVANAQLLMPSPSPKASVSERIGITDVTINYSRPAVAGREGKIWGGVVYEGLKPLNYGGGNPAPWCAGDNANTTIEFSTDVLIEGHELPAGKYGFFIDYRGPANNAIAIFSKNNAAWGSYFYDDKQAAMKVEVAPVHLQQSTERLTYEFVNEDDSGAVIVLTWEKLAIPVRVSTKLRETQIASINREMQGEKGFDVSAQLQAAGYLCDNNTDLVDALLYASRAAYTIPSFNSLVMKGTIQEKLRMQKIADGTIKEALSIGDPTQIFNYGRLLLSQKLVQKAMEVFEYNSKRFPNTFLTNLGLSDGYAALGKRKEAVKYAEAALPQAPDAADKKGVEEIIAGLKKR